MKISRIYTLSFLIKHPLTKPIILKHLHFADESQLSQVHDTLENLATTNMGGGIPYGIMVKLVKELDKIPAHVFK